MIGRDFCWYDSMYDQKKAIPEVRMVRGKDGWKNE
jgi:hypothetical protein